MRLNHWVTGAFLALFVCVVPSAYSLVDNFQPQAIDHVFYTFLFTTVLFAAAIVFALHQLQWLLYVCLSLFLIANSASLDGSLFYFWKHYFAGVDANGEIQGNADFVLWVVPILLSTVTAAYGYWLVSQLIAKEHWLARLKPLFFILALVTLVIPISSYFWLKKIPLDQMWVPANMLFFGMVVSQVLPPFTWRIDNRLQKGLMRLFPIVVGLFALTVYFVYFVTDNLSQAQINIYNRFVLLLFTAFSMGIVLLQALTNTREKVKAEKHVLRTEKQRAELEVSLLQAEKDYEKALDVVSHHRSQLAGVSHDLKQPIAALRMAVDQMQRSTNNQNEADKLARALDYIDSLVLSYLDECTSENNANDVGRQNDFESKAEPIATSLLANTLQQMFTQQAKEQGVSLKFFCHEAIVKVEPLLCMRAMSNLVGNALTHAKASRILVAFRRRGNKIIFQVRDNGCGMDADTLQSVLHDGYKSSESSGHGLGLGIVESICKAQAIDFSIHSKPRKGTAAFMAITITLSD